jgi:hypothetical protein
MRAPLFGLTALFLLATGSFALHAQTNTNVAPPNPPAARENSFISFLTPAQQDQYAKARAKALADNPALKTEGDKVKKQGETVLTTGTAAERQAFMEKMNSHRQKLRQAMLKEDASLEPIFAEIDKHISEMKAKGQVSSAATNTPAVAH